jgi:hypothetical protein
MVYGNIITGSNLPDERRTEKGFIDSGVPPRSKLKSEEKWSLYFMWGSHSNL